MPPFLETSVSFDDKATGGSKGLDSAEAACLMVKVNNTGGGPSGDVLIEVESSSDVPTVAGRYFMGGIMHQSNKKICIPVVAPIDLEPGLLDYTIRTIEAGGNDAQTVNLTIEAHSGRLPELQFSDQATTNEDPKSATVDYHQALVNGNIEASYTYNKKRNILFNKSTDDYFQRNELFSTCKYLTPSSGVRGMLKLKANVNTKGKVVRVKQVRIKDKNIVKALAIGADKKAVGKVFKCIEKAIKTINFTPVRAGNIPLGYTLDLTLNLFAKSDINGDGDGMLESGEQAQVVFNVINQGGGESYYPHGRITLDDSICPAKVVFIRNYWRGNDMETMATCSWDFINSKLGSGDTLTVKPVVRIADDAHIDQFTMNAELVEYRSRRDWFPGKKQKYEVDVKQIYPKIIFDYVIHDGTREGVSQGNKNGLIDQGENILLEMAMVNVGEIGTRGATLRISTDKEGVKFTVNEQKVSDLPIQNEPRRAEFLFSVQRATKAGILPLTIAVDPIGFEMVEEIINLQILPEGIREIVYHSKAKIGDPFWVAMPEAPPKGQLWSVGVFQDKTILMLASAKNGGLLLSHEYGKWVAVELPNKDVTVTASAIAGNKGAVVYVGGDDGNIYISHDKGQSWNVAMIGDEPLGDTLDEPINSMAAGGKDGLIMLASTSDGLYRSADGGRSFAKTTPNSGEPFEGFVWTKKTSNHIFAWSKGGISASKDGGENWKNLPWKVANGRPTALVVKPGKTPRLYAASDRGQVLVSKNKGKSWSEIGKGKAMTCTSMPCRIRSVAVDARKGNVYALGESGEIKVYSRKGKRWSPMVTGIPSNVDMQTARLLTNTSGKVVLSAQGATYQLGALKSQSVVSTIGFNTGQSILKTVAKTSLKKFAKKLLKDKSRIVIEGHSDSIGSQKLNQKLSEKRAQAVKVFLVSLGVAEDRIEANGYGMLRPVASNNTEKGREKNRRVEISSVAL